MNNLLAYTQQTTGYFFSYKTKAYVAMDKTSPTGLKVTGLPKPITRKMMNKGLMMLRGLPKVIDNLTIQIEST